ncbi:MAG: CDP-glucose 4,6-dehydratase [Thermodesulfobacteriota bacterium]|nr:CDP-glucose 4,6-dehydratase [Thermodesulfobacteriota bacterium]
MNARFWKGKKVLITGHTGFKGSWLSLWLQNKGANVVGYALSPPTTPNFFEVGNIASGLESILGDIRDFEKMKSVVDNHQPEIVIHMAAQPLVRYSYNNPIETYETNVMGTVNVLEAVRQTDCVKVVLIITSDKCYENKEWLWGYRENDPMGGHDPYSNSKGCAELVTSAYRKSYFSESGNSDHGVAVATARAGNVIGGGDWGLDRLVPDIMQAVMEDRSVEIRYPHAVRPWQHVLEPLDGYMCLIERLWKNGSQYGGGWNFGPSDEDCKPVSWILSTLDSLWKGGVSWNADEADNPHEANYLKLDCSKSRTLLGWAPKLDLMETIELVVEWYEGYVGKQNMRVLAGRQISRYESME